MSMEVDDSRMSMEEEGGHAGPHAQLDLTGGASAVPAEEAAEQEAAQEETGDAGSGTAPGIGNCDGLELIGEMRGMLDQLNDEVARWQQTCEAALSEEKQAPVAEPPVPMSMDVPDTAAEPGGKTQERETEAVPPKSEAETTAGATETPVSEAHPSQGVQPPQAAPNNSSNEPLVTRYHIIGFANDAMNTIYSISDVMVGGKQTYWSPSQDYFMYYQADIQKWQISPRSGPSERGDGDMDLLQDAMRGGQRGLAMQLEETAWRQFVNGLWQLVDLAIGFDMGDGYWQWTNSVGGQAAPPTAGFGMGQAAPGTPAPAWAQTQYPQGQTQFQAPAHIASRIPLTPQVGGATQRIPQTPRDRLLQRAGLAPAPGTPSGRAAPGTPTARRVNAGEMPPPGATNLPPSVSAKMLQMPERFLPDELKASAPKKRKVIEEPTRYNFGKAPEKFPVWVGFFDDSIQDEQILEFFGDCGPVVEMERKDYQALVQFQAHDDRQAALFLDGYLLGGQAVAVTEQDFFEPRPEINGQVEIPGQSKGQSQNWGRGQSHGQDQGQGYGHSQSHWKNDGSSDWSSNRGGGRDWDDSGEGSWGQQQHRDTSRSWDHRDHAGWSNRGDAEWTGSGTSAGSTSQGQSQGQAKSVNIPKHMFGSVIGKGGEVIKRLQEQSGSRMQLDKEWGTLSISGSPSCIEEGLRLVDEILNGPSQKGPEGSGSGSEAMEIPKNKVPSVIGRGGEVIKKLQADSGASLKIDRGDQSGPCQVIMSGSPSSIAAARQLIEQIVWSEPQSMKPQPTKSGSVTTYVNSSPGVERGPATSAVGQSTSANGASTSLPDTPARKQEPQGGKGKGKSLPTEHMDVPLPKAERLRGALKQIQRDACARVMLEETKGNCRVCFSGTQENILRARELVQALLDREPPSGPGPLGVLAKVVPKDQRPKPTSAAGADARADAFERACAQAITDAEWEADAAKAAAAEATLTTSASALEAEDEFERLCAAKAAEASAE